MCWNSTPRTSGRGTWTVAEGVRTLVRGIVEEIKTRVSDDQKEMLGRGTQQEQRGMTR